MDDKTWLRTFLLAATCITGIDTSYILYKEGCINNTNEGVTNVTIKTTLPNNYPGTCYAYCKNQNKLSNESYLALQNETCLCGEHYSVLKKQYKLTCSDTCPGHNVHHCGQVSSATFSVYKVALDLNVTDETSCAIANCQFGRRDLTPINCNSSQQTHCIHKYPGIKPKCQPAPVSWDSVYCESYDQLHFFSQKEELCVLIGACSGPAWAGIFAPRAPPKSCFPTNITHGHWNYTYSGSEAVEYHCDSGYRLTVNSTVYCMDGGKWKINPPSCVASTTTTAGTTTTASTSTTSTPTPTITTTIPSTSTSTTPTLNVTTMNPSTSSTTTNKSTAATLPTSTTAGQKKYFYATIGLSIPCGILLITVIGLSIYIFNTKKARNRTFPTTAADLLPADESEDYAPSNERGESTPLPEIRHEQFPPLTSPCTRFLHSQINTLDANSRPSTSLTNTDIHLTCEVGNSLNEQLHRQNNGAALEQAVVDETIHNNDDDTNAVHKRHKERKKSRHKKNKKRSRRRSETDGQPGNKEQEAWNGDDTTTTHSSTAQSDVPHSNAEDTFNDACPIAP